MQRKNRQQAIVIATAAIRKPFPLPAVVVTVTVAATVLSPSFGLGVVAAALAWLLAEG